MCKALQFINANIATLSATCAPLDLFGVGRFSQSALDYVTTIADPTASRAGPGSTTLFARMLIAAA